MSIAGLQRISLVDYPGKIATTIFLSGCNFHCGYCHNPDLIKYTSSGESLEEVLKYIKNASEKKWIDGVCITGGESTTSPILFQLIDEIKKIGLPIKLDTNGAKPELLPHLDVDYIAMDIKTAPSRYRELTNIKNIDHKIKSSINFLLSQNKVPYEFRTTLTPNLVEKSELSEISKIISRKGPTVKWFWQNFNNSKTLNKKYESMTPYTREELEVYKKDFNSCKDITIAIR